MVKEKINLNSVQIHLFYFWFWKFQNYGNFLDIKITLYALSHFGVFEVSQRNNILRQKIVYDFDL